MKTLSEIKMQIAEDFEFKNWAEMYNMDEVSNVVIDAISKRYAEEALKEAAKRAKAYNQVPRSYSDAAVDKESILSLIKELK